MTTKLLESLIEKASALPAEVQDMLAGQWLAELEDERKWDDKFAASQEAVDTLAERALRRHQQGETVAKGWDEL